MNNNILQNSLKDFFLMGELILEVRHLVSSNAPMHFKMHFWTQSIDKNIFGSALINFCIVKR